jgi:hypothetical protein
VRRRSGALRRLAPLKGVPMTGDEARRRLEASTRFEIRSGLVWLRDLRWWIAVAGPAPAANAAVGGPDPADASGSRDGTGSDVGPIVERVT